MARSAYGYFQIILVANNQIFNIAIYFECKLCKRTYVNARSIMVNNKKRYPCSHGAYTRGEEEKDIDPFISQVTVKLPE